MKKAIRKLIVRREIVRVFEALDNRDLARVVGGDDDVLVESHKTCPAAAAGLPSTQAGC